MENQASNPATDAESISSQQIKRPTQDEVSSSPILIPGLLQAAAALSLLICGVCVILIFFGVPLATLVAILCLMNAVWMYTARSLVISVHNIEKNSRKHTDLLKAMASRQNNHDNQ